MTYLTKITRRLIQLRWSLLGTFLTYLLAYVLVLGIDHRSAETIYPFFRYFHQFPLVLVIHGILLLAIPPIIRRGSRPWLVHFVAQAVGLAILLGWFTTDSELIDLRRSLYLFAPMNYAVLLTVHWLQFRGRSPADSAPSSTSDDHDTTLCLGYGLFVVALWLKFQFPLTHRMSFQWEVIPVENFQQPVLLGGILVCLGLVTCFRKRIQLPGLGLISLVASLVVHADVLFYEYFGELPSVEHLRLLHQIPRTTSSLLAMASWDQLIPWVDIPVWGFLLEYRTGSNSRLTKVINRIVPRESRLPFGLTLFCVSLGGLLIVPGFLNLKKLATDRDHQVAFYGDELVTSSTGLIGYHAFDSYRALVRQPGITARERNRTERFFRAHPHGEVRTSQPKRKNVVLIVAESFHPVVLNHTWHNRSVTPTLNRLARNAVISTSVYDVTGGAGAGSSDAKFAILNSLLPLKTVPVTYEFKTNDFRALPAILADRGYTTTSTSGSFGSVFNSEIIYRQYGIDQRWFRTDWEAKPFDWWGIADQPLMDRAGQRLGAVDRPFFSLIVSSTSHHPFDVPEGSTDFSEGPPPETLVEQYLKAMNYLDGAVSILIDRLKEHDRYRDTVFVIVGDHTPSFDQSRFEAIVDNPDRLANQRNRVPFVLFDPGNRSTIPINQPASQLDITPTLLGYLGLSSEHPYMIGNNLFRDEKRFPIVPFPDGRIAGDQFMYRPPPTEQCLNQSTKERVSMEQCLEFKKEGETLRRMSNQVIYGNLLAGLKQEK